MNGPGNDERRPARGGDSVGQHNNHANSSANGRRNAACRDFHAERGNRHTSWCWGTPSVRPVLREMGVPTMWDRQRQAWAIPTNRLDDVLVYAEHVDRRFVTVSEAAA